MAHASQAVARLKAELTSARPSAEPSSEDWRPNPGAGAYFAELLERNFLRVLHAADEDARILALAGLNPPRSVLEDHGLGFASRPALETAHAALDQAVARLLAP